jgi:hypothetical protein
MRRSSIPSKGCGPGSRAPPPPTSAPTAWTPSVTSSGGSLFVFVNPSVRSARLFEATKPGGWLCVEDADLLSLRHASTADPDFFARGYAAFVGCMIANGYQAQLGLHLGDLLRRAGLEYVQVRGWVGEWTGAGPNPSVYLRTF